MAAVCLQIEVEQIMKNGFDHFMQKEIHEQPESLQSTMRGRVQFQRCAVSWSTIQQTRLLLALLACC
jgi:glucosamine 6-phosphate synthetase-like amidotransferase/phosphosugar isomerase protein